DGDASKPGNPSYTVNDLTLGTTQTFTFDLRATPTKIMVGERGGDYDYPISYISLVGLNMEFGENMVEVVPLNGATIETYIEPGSAKRSLLMKKLNPPL